MRINLDHVTERIFAVTQPVHVGRGVIPPDFGSLTPPGRRDARRKRFDVGVGDTDVEETVLPVFKRGLPPLMRWRYQLEQLKSDSIGGAQMSLPHLSEGWPENVGCHLARMPFVRKHFKGTSQENETEDLRIKLNRAIEIGYSNSNVIKDPGIRRGLNYHKTREEEV